MRVLARVWALGSRMRHVGLESLRGLLFVGGIGNGYVVALHMRPAGRGVLRVAWLVTGAAPCVQFLGD